MKGNSTQILGDKSNSKDSSPRILRPAMLPSNTSIEMSPTKSLRSRNSIAAPPEEYNKLRNYEKQVVNQFIRIARKEGTLAGLEALDSQGNRKQPESGHRESRWHTINASMVNLDPNTEDEFGLLDDEPDELDFFDKEFEETAKKRSCLINPNGKFKLVFDHIILLAVFYVATFGAFKLGFVQVVESPLWTPTDFFVDFLFLCDIVLTFFTPRIIDNELIRSHK